MAKHWRDVDQSFNCTRINRLVDITTRIVSVPERGEVHYPFVCSGFSTCRLFPLRYFPEVTVVRAPTGCPFFDSLRITTL